MRALLDDASLERSPVVANSRMNRERQAVGGNSYEKELGLNPIAFLTERLQTDDVSWLDLCCGRGRALIEAAETFEARGCADRVRIHGVDLVDFFDEIPAGLDCLQLETASLHQWESTRKHDLITCVHGLHYVGDTLSLIERAAGWLKVDGLFLANFDPANLRQANGRPLGRRVVRGLRDSGFNYNSRRHLLTCVGARRVSLGFRYLGADDTAGPNYSGQEAVDSYYEP